jgi:hypothetical protein
VNIAFDDYDKDYSDLPAPIMTTHLALESVKTAVSYIESVETKEREVSQEKDDIRKRERQERLNVLRGGGCFKNWTRLERESPSDNPLEAAAGKAPKGAGTRDSELFN